MFSPEFEKAFISALGTSINNFPFFLSSLFIFSSNIGILSELK